MTQPGQQQPGQPQQPTPQLSDNSYVPPQPGYGPFTRPEQIYGYQHPVTQSAQQTSFELTIPGIYKWMVLRKKTWLLFAISTMGSLVIMCCVFMPAYVLEFSPTTLSMNGLGDVSGPAIFVNTAKTAWGTDDERGSTGKYILAIGIIAFALSLGGLYQKDKNYAIGLIVIGFIACGLAIFQFANKLESATKVNADYSSSNNVFGFNALVGFGIYVGIIGAAMLLAGAILTFKFFKVD
jgi:hypothetical protein